MFEMEVETRVVLWWAFLLFAHLGQSVKSPRLTRLPTIHFADYVHIFSANAFVFVSILQSLVLVGLIVSNQRKYRNKAVEDDVCCKICEPGYIHP